MSLRLKLIVVVLGIALMSLLAVFVSSLSIVREGQREFVRAADRQVSDVLSRAIMAQVSEYRNKVVYIHNSWLGNPNVKVESGLFPDYLWIRLIELTGKQNFEWSAEDQLNNAGISSEMLLGKKKSDDLYQEAKALFHKPDQWMVFNSTIQPLLPTFLLVTALARPGETEPSFLGLAEIRAEKLFSNVHGRPGQQLILIDPHQNILLSTKEGWDPSEVSFQDAKSLELISSLEDAGSMFLTMEYREKEPQVTSIYKFSEGGLTLMLQQPVSLLRAGEKKMEIQSGVIALFVLLFTFNLLIFFARSITSPLMQLMKLMEKVGKGEFTGKVVVKSKDEIGRMANMFNKMLGDLKSRDTEIDAAKSRLIQSEKMSAFGQMSAGIAHEVKNPLAGILGYAQMSKKKLQADSPVFPYLDIIEKETVRCKEIVENLMKFARQEKALMMRIDINKTIKDSIRLVEHQIGISGIKLTQIFALDGAPIWIKGNANQIQQVMMNLILNAQQAMENKGTITVSTHFSLESQKVLIMISDTGPGMTEEVKARIFEPFFTTKGVGKGTGLGLAVSIGIVKDHGGTIDVDSMVGKGTTFTITLACDREQITPQTEAAAS
jgi:two-component system NtrC family sensor kinase